MALKKVRKSNSIPESPEALFHDLRGKTIPGMLSYQADVIRNYVDQALTVPDVALQLPTGSGKTLVGLIIGDWRRRKREERVLYLCPTNQLVYQVAREAKQKYGIHVNTFTGSKSSFDEIAKREYQNAEAIAIASYSSLFNTSPYFTNPQLVILDDAHVAFSRVRDSFTMRIEREENGDLYGHLTNIFRNEFVNIGKGGTFDDIVSGADSAILEVPYWIWKERSPEIREYLRPKSEKFPFVWSFLRDNFDYCHCLINQNAFM